MAKTIKNIKKILIGLLGATILAIGLVMVFTPVPGLLVMPIGLSVLATEFECMKRMENKLKLQMEKLKNKVINN